VKFINGNIMDYNDKKGIVILGHPRSGTTLTRRLLNAHSQIACPPETHLLSACVRFLKSEKTAFGVDIGALAGLSFAGVEDEVVLHKLRDFAFSFLKDYALQEGKNRWAEKTAFDAFHIKGIEKFCGDHASFVGIIRHPLDVAMSSIEFCNSMGYYPKEMHRYIREYSQPIEAFAHSWLDVSQDLIDLSEQQSNKCKIYRYEDLVSSTEETLTQMLGTLGERFEEEMLEHALKKDKSLGFGDHKSYQRKQVHNDSIGKWNSLPEYQIQKLAPLLNPMLEQLGYDTLKERKAISVHEARRQYIKGMEIVTQRSHDVKAVKKTKVDTSVIKLEQRPRVCVYGRVTAFRTEIFHEEVCQLAPELTNRIINLDIDPAYLFSVTLLTLLKRIGEDNQLKFALHKKNCITALEDSSQHDDTFSGLIERLSAHENESALPLSNFDIILNYSSLADGDNTALLKDEVAALSDAALRLSVISNIQSSKSKLSNFALCFSFNDAVWPEPLMRQRAIEHFQIIIEIATQNLKQSISKFPLLTKEEQQLSTNKMLFDEFPATLITRFRTQVEQRPLHPAIVFDDKVLTYQELNKRVCILSSFLRSKGIESGKTVAVCLERSENLVTTLLAVLHAGGTYIPIDPGFPQLRISQILEDAVPHFILSEEKSTSKIDSDLMQKTYCIEDSLWEKSANVDVPPNASGDLAYIIFTSGSTGRPKGVEVCQNGLSTFLDAMSEKPGLDKNDRMLSVTTISFDIAGLELYLPLIVGATVYIASRRDTIDGNALQESLVGNKITCFQATPATYHLLLGTNWSGDPALKLLCGGEAMPPELSLKLLDKCSSLWNMYGPTETTIWSTVKEVDKVLSPMPIGKAIKGTQTYVLNNEFARVPIGVSGELFIGGEGVANGYFNRADLTEACFIPDPFSEHDNAIMYRTGDLAKMLDDGDLVYLGRLDNQVKIRGYRIELGEIETAIRTMVGVDQCVVGVYEHGLNSKSLVAYIIANCETNKIDILGLRQYLQPLIPGYMIPSFVKLLEAFPLTPNNKIDRKALPSLMDADTAPADEARETTPVQENSLKHNQADNGEDREYEILTSWKRIMGMQQVYHTDSFISLGGDSLSYVQVTIELESILGTIPDDWEQLSIKELSKKDKVKYASPSIKKDEAIKEGKWKNAFIDMDITIFIRAFAIASIVFLHALPNWGIHGNTGALFIVAGFLFSKFQFTQVEVKQTVAPIIWSAIRIFVPSTIIMGLILLWNGNFRVDVLFLYSNFTAPIATYWYVQVLLQIILVMALLFSIRKIVIYAKHEPYKFGMYLLTAATILMIFSPLFEPEHGKHRQLPHVRFWQFAIGWCIFYSDTHFRRITTAHLLVLIAGTQFILMDRGLGLEDPILTIVLGLLLLTQFKITVIKPFNYLIYALASSSLFIFLSHRQFFALVDSIISIDKELKGVIAFLVALLGGYLLWLFWEKITKGLIITFK
jgi:amino acid adenylation domain-containing protein